jgi:gas vesicle protein
MSLILSPLTEDWTKPPQSISKDTRKLKEAIDELGDKIQAFIDNADHHLKRGDVDNQTESAKFIANWKSEFMDLITNGGNASDDPDEQ